MILNGIFLKNRFMSVLNIPYINIHDKAPVEQYPSRDKFEHWVFPPANILIHWKGKIWTGTKSPWTVETYVHIKHSVSSVNKLTRVISVLSTRAQLFKRWINLYPVDSAIATPNTYPLDSDLSDGYLYPVF